MLTKTQTQTQTTKPQRKAVQRMAETTATSMKETLQLLLMGGPMQKIGRLPARLLLAEHMNRLRAQVRQPVLIWQPAKQYWCLRWSEQKQTTRARWRSWSS